MDDQTRDRFLTGVTGRLRAVLPRLRQVTVFGDRSEVLYDSTGFAGPIELDAYHRVRDTEPLQTYEGVAARCTYDEDGACLALFSLAGAGRRAPWHILLRIQQPRGGARVGEATVRRLTPLLRRLCAPLARLPNADPALDRRLRAIARERDSGRRLAQLLLTGIDVLGAQAAFVSAPSLGEYAAMYAKSAPRAWRGDAALRGWIDALAPSRLSSSIALAPKSVEGAPAGARGVLCVPLSGLPGKTVGRFVLLFAADEPLPVSLPTLLRLAALVVGCVAEDRDRVTGAWKQQAFLRRAAALRTGRARAHAIAVLHLRPDWSGWDQALDPRLRGLQALAGFLRAKLPPQAVLGLVRGGAFVALLPVAQAEAARGLAAALTASAAARARRDADAMPRLAVRHAVAGAAPGAFTTAIAEILHGDAPAAATPLAPDATLLQPLWAAGSSRTRVLLVRAPGPATPIPVDPSATGVFVDAALGVDLQYLDRVFRHAAELDVPAVLLLSVAATSIADRAFRAALARLAAPLAPRGHALQVLVSARYADEHPARLVALRGEGWKVGLHLFAGGRLQVRELAATRDECVFVAGDLVQECLRSELSRLQLGTVLAQARRAGYRLCVPDADVAALKHALAGAGAPSAPQRALEQRQRA